ncbi:5-methyltetrahydrofolate:corrinoid/iron-sulfur protein co-methyltransferase [Anaerohalosphaera lusitana]|uniref:5-methyltetrahydrofolate:corrinoid/iron-sulfur protein co-methyltransferase n=1 Tax=Anaerohalosphaera lusitana TaxID=1936003 RepID=A0A1U9NKC3_9BACT|nr:dihydropteroate synthase [Anaerohalosphaera lusitana]AQT68349.1 5-methyltetrahydrofolate:corrinoid/iron-sulfur protein co-methyltransferase [Anaerohalosphaera lusitana]
MTDRLISIAESLHASIPSTRRVMDSLHELGPDCFSDKSEPLGEIKKIIQSQADEGADFIAVNVDAYGEDDPHKTIEYMREYVKLIKQFGQGVPPCIDSSNDDALVAGLKAWYEDNAQAAVPLINSIKTYNADKLMPLRDKFEYSFIAMLVAEEKGACPGGVDGADELVGLAKQIFDKAIGYGFKPDQIYYDTTVFPLAIDMPMQPGVPSYTHRAFETIRRIKQDPEMAGVHFSLGISNCCRDLPGRKIGICRAYVEKAMEYGLDAGIVNVFHHYGEKPADPQLVELVDAFAAIDGDDPAMTNDAMMKMSQFCSSFRG